MDREMMWRRIFRDCFALSSVGMCGGDFDEIQSIVVSLLITFDITKYHQYS